MHCWGWLEGRPCFFGNAHGHEAARTTPAAGLIDAAVIFDLLVLEGPLPVVGIENRLAAPIGENKVEADSHCGLYAFPA